MQIDENHSSHSVDLNQNLSISYLLSMRVKYLLSGSCKNQVDSYKEYYSLLNILWFNGVHINFSTILETIGKSEIGLKILGSLTTFSLQGFRLGYITVFQKVR